MRLSQFSDNSELKAHHDAPRFKHVLICSMVRIFTLLKDGTCSIQLSHAPWNEMFHLQLMKYFSDQHLLFVYY